MKLLQPSAIFKQINCYKVFLRLKVLDKNGYDFKFERNITSTLRMVTKGQVNLTFFLLLYFYE